MHLQKKKKESLKKSSEKKLNVLLGVTGSIAAYKSVELLRMLVKSGYQVDVVLTEGAELFITPLTFSSLTNGKVYSSSSEASEPFAHLELAKKTDMILICPATANTINKLSAGIADNLLTSLVIVSSATKIVCPAMNVNMYRSLTVRESLKRLEEMGFVVVSSEPGRLACGDEGEGRLADISRVFETVSALSSRIGSLTGKKVLVVSGCTREWIDDVRFISNASSGKMGTALAAEAKALGAEVVFVTGPSNYRFYQADRLIEVESALEMREVVLKEAKNADVVVMAAAVSDFTLKKTGGKIKKEGVEELVLKLEKTPDILKELVRTGNNAVTVGFSLESEKVLENAVYKMKQKGVDLMIANTPENFSSELASAFIVRKDGTFREIRNAPKRVLAREVFFEVSKLLEESA